MEPIWLAAIGLLCATALGALWMTRRASRPERDLAALLASERAELRAEFGLALDRALEIGEQIKKTRARIDGHKGAAISEAMRLAPAAPALETLTPEAVSTMPVADQLRWAASRRRRA